MSKITQESLDEHGFNRFEWNGGRTIEYWKSIRADGAFDYRVGVRFHPTTIEGVFILLPLAGYKIWWFTALEQVLDLHKLLAQPQEE